MIYLEAYKFWGGENLSVFCLLASFFNSGTGDNWPPKEDIKL